MPPSLGHVGAPGTGAPVQSEVGIFPRSAAPPFWLLCPFRVKLRNDLQSGRAVGDGGGAWKRGPHACGGRAGGGVRFLRRGRNARPLSPSSAVSVSGSFRRFSEGRPVVVQAGASLRIRARLESRRAVVSPPADEPRGGKE